MGLAILLIGALWVAGADPLGATRTSYEVWMSDAGGVRAGEQVRMAGVEVGRVDEVVLRPGDPWPVVFRISLDSNIPLSEKSTARFASDGLLGTKFLALEPGPQNSNSLPVGKPIHGRAGPGIDQALARFEELSTQVGTLLEQTSETIKLLRERTEPLLDRVDLLLSEENVQDATATLAALRRTTEEIGPQLGPMIQRLEEAADELKTGAQTVPNLAAEVQGLATDLRQAMGPDGERLAALFETAEKTLGSAEGTFRVVEGSSDELEAALRDLREAAVYFKSFTQQLQEQPVRVLRNKPGKSRLPGEGIE